MSRRRIRNKGLPRRVYVHRRMFRFVPQNGKPIPLAPVDDYAGMLTALAAWHQEAPSIQKMSDLMDRYELVVLPEKGERSQKDQPPQLNRLRQTFGHMRPEDLRQPHVYEYMHRRAETAPTAANREMELLRHVMTKAVEWGVLLSNPLKGMRKIKRPPRKRYVTDAEFDYVRSLASPMVQSVMDIALLTGLRRGDIFRLKKSDYTDDGLVVLPNKTCESTGVILIFELTEEFASVLDRAISLPPERREYIVGNRKAEPYTKNGFDSVWQRLMNKATNPDSPNSIERFEFRDFRRKSASDEVDERVAQQRLGHATVAITNRVYRVKPRRVRPLR